VLDSQLIAQRMKKLRELLEPIQARDSERAHTRSGQHSQQVSLTDSLALSNFKLQESPILQSDAQSMKNSELTNPTWRAARFDFTNSDTIPVLLNSISRQVSKRPVGVTNAIGKLCVKLISVTVILSIRNIELRKGEG